MGAKATFFLPPKEIVVMENEAYYEQPELNKGGNIEEKYGMKMFRKPDVCKTNGRIYVVTRAWFTRTLE